VFIANEENGSFRGIGVDQLSIEGYMDFLKAGPVFWIDAADSQPCQGTAGVIPWKIEVTGKLFHSGLPHKGINSIEMAMDCVSYMQKNFYRDFPRDPREDDYAFTTCSTLKPTQVSCTEGSLNQIPPFCTVQGDIRLSPFYDKNAAVAALERYVAEINADPSRVLQGDGTGVHGPHSHYALPDEDGRKGTVKLTVFDGENGIAVNLKSPGFQTLTKATQHVLKAVRPYAIGGTLPLVREMQDNGFDLQIVGE
jgi:acetylornithine deacetylase